MEELNKKFVEMLGKEKGYFGRVYTWGQKPTKYEFIGYELTENFLPILQNMSKDQLMNFKKIIIYFEIHAIALKELLIAKTKDQYGGLYYEIAWSHFIIIIMFGMLEIATKNKYGKIKMGEKKKKIKKFFEESLSKEIKDKISKDYKVDNIYNYNIKIKSFSDVFDHLWHQIRSGFIHDASMESRGLEWGELEGIGTKDDPITFKKNVPVQDLLKITWQAILNSYGYKGTIKLPKYSGHQK